MKIGLSAGGTIDRVIGQCAEAEADGFASMWFAGNVGPDPLTAIALAGRGSSKIELGTSVVPTYPRHPMTMAAQTATVRAALGPDRFTLGIGVSHKPVIEGLGYSYDKPAKHMRDYLKTMRGMFGERAPFDGQVVVAALAPLMLRAAAELADGTITWMANRQAIADHIGPQIRAAAEAAGRPAPRIVVGLPVAVCDDPAQGREVAAKQFAGYGQLPNYRRVLDKGGAGGPGDVAVVGDEGSVAEQLAAIIDAGATDIWAAVYPVGDDRSGSRRRTRDLLKELANA